MKKNGAHNNGNGCLNINSFSLPISILKKHKYLIENTKRVAQIFLILRKEFEYLASFMEQWSIIFTPVII